MQKKTADYHQRQTNSVIVDRCKLTAFDMAFNTYFGKLGQGLGFSNPVLKKLDITNGARKGYPQFITAHNIYISD
jgi:hypothetical protein